MKTTIVRKLTLARLAVMLLVGLTTFSLAVRVLGARCGC